MSDVLTTNFYEENSILISGLNNPQVIRTAEMLDISAVLLVRGKKPTEDTIAMADENNIILISTDYNMYNSCGILYSNGIKGITNEKNKKLCVHNSKE
jgi:predicted transcriptional regulator